MFGWATLRTMRRGAAISGVILMASAAPARSSASPVGTWLTEGGHGVIAIAECGDALCGRIVGIDRAPGAPMPTDVQGRPECGLTILTNEKPTSDQAWLGQITDPRNGRTYGAKLWVDGNGNLHLRGFLGVPLLGSTQVWRPFTGQLSADCAIASAAAQTPRAVAR